MSLRSKLGVFVLTREEQRTIAFVVLAFVLGLVTQHYRHARFRPAGVPNDRPEATASPSSATPIR